MARRFDDLFPAATSLLHVPRRTSTAAVAAAAAGAGYAVHVLPARRSGSKQQLLAELASALAFPGWFGHNWDALADCLADLEGRHCVIWRGAARFAAADPDGSSIVTEIFAECSPDRLVVIAVGV